MGLERALLSLATRRNLAAAVEIVGLMAGRWPALRYFLWSSVRRDDNYCAVGQLHAKHQALSDRPSA